MATEGSSRTAPRDRTSPERCRGLLIAGCSKPTLPTKTIATEEPPTPPNAGGEPLRRKSCLSTSSGSLACLSTASLDWISRRRRPATVKRHASSNAYVRERDNHGGHLGADHNDSGFACDQAIECRRQGQQQGHHAANEMVSCATRHASNSRRPFFSYLLHPIRTIRYCLHHLPQTKCTRSGKHQAACRHSRLPAAPQISRLSQTSPQCSQATLATLRRLSLPDAR